MATSHQERRKARMDEREKLLKENESIKTRQTEMKAEAAAAFTEMERLEQFITDATIAGKDSAKEQAQLQSVKAKHTIYEKALQQSGKQIEANRMKAEEDEMLARRADFDGDADIWALQLVEAYNAGKVFKSKFDALIPTLSNLQSHGFDVAAYDETILLHTFFLVLRAGFEGATGLTAQLQQIESRFPEILEKARKK